MSRYVIYLEQAAQQVVVGWDAGLATYFAQVQPAGDADVDELLLWAGTSPGEIPNVEQLQYEIRETIEIPQDILENLEHDKKTERFGSVLLDLLSNNKEQ